MTESYRAARVEGGGKIPEIQTLETPTPGPGEVLVRLHAAALNFADLLMLDGRYQDTPPFPFTPGIEGAGQIVASGRNVNLSPGMRVAVNAQGTLAEFGVFAANHCTPIPDAMSYAEAAGFLIAYGTSHLALTLRGALGPGQTLIVLGAAGGVGLTAVEIGAALGARVIAVARGSDRLDAARAAGAEILIDSSTTDDLKAALRAHGGADVVYDPVGDAPGLAAFSALERGGRYLVIGFAGGKPPQLPLNHALVKNIAIHGLYWGGYRTLDPTALTDSLDALVAMYEAGKLRPHVGTRVGFEDLARGYELLRDRKVTGKLIVDILPPERGGSD